MIYTSIQPRLHGLWRPLAVVALCLALASCTSAGNDRPVETQTGTKPSMPDYVITLPSVDSAAPSPDDGLLTLPPETIAAPIETTQPAGGGTLRDDINYTALIITSYYATGNVAGRALVDASYVEVYNNSSVPVPLAGVSLYVSNGGKSFEEYAFFAEDSVPAKGHFLIRGRNANGESRDVITVEAHDRQFPGLAPAPSNTRLVIAPAGQALPTDKPLASMDGLFAYVTSHPIDAADVNHYVKSPSSNELIRKKASTDKTDYQTVDLTEASSATLSLIRPHTTAGDVNQTVTSLLDEVIFSHPSGIYKEGFDLTLTAPEGYTIYFTINDTDPRDARPITYKNPLHMQNTTEMSWGRLTSTAGRQMSATYAPLTSTFPGALVVKAFATRASDGAVTPLATRTYFIGELFSSWEVDLVSLTLDSELFIGPEGIYNNIIQGVGAVREQVPAYVEWIAPEGNAVHTGWCEVAMNGKGSLGMTQKSFRLLFKSSIKDAPDIGENLSTMDYDIFGKYASQTPDGEPVTWFRHVLLRNGGGDMSGSTISRSHIGDAYIQRVDRFLRPDIMAYAPAMVFVNGEFWGLYNARERLDHSYFEIKYSIPEEDISVVECPYPLFYGWNVDYTAGVTDPAELAEAEYFMELVRFCQQNDMALEENYRYIADRIDIDSLIDFYCAQIYLNCSDWPSNNIKIWRNKNPNHPTVDTRWHFCIVDTDHGVGLNSQVDTNLWGVINDGPVISRIIHHLLQNPGFRERFHMRYIWCIEVYFAPERLTAELDALVDPLLPIMQYQLDRWRCTNGERTDWDKWYSYIDIIRDYVIRRPAIAKSQFMNWAGLSEGTYIQLQNKAIAEWGSKVHNP